MTTLADTRHIVWDWNGTIFSDNHAVVAAVNSVCESYGRPSITLEQWRTIFSRPLLACYERLLGRSLAQDDWAWIDRTYHEVYRDLLPTCALADGVPEVLRQWRTAGGSQSLLSMWFHHELVPMVSEFGLDELFGRVDGLRAEIGGGPKAEHLDKHLAELGVDPRETVVIGDVADDAAAQCDQDVVISKAEVCQRSVDAVDDRKGAGFFRPRHDDHFRLDACFFQ